MKFNRLLMAAMMMAGSGAAQAEFFVVNSTADVPDAAPGNGSCNPVNAIGDTCTLRAAIMEANALTGAHSILVASGTYELSLGGADEDDAQTGDLDITADITIVNGTSNRPVIDGLGADRVFDVLDGGTLTLDNIHVQGGEANQPGTTRGGGIQVAGGAALILDTAVIADNVANIGGAIYSDGDVSIVDSTLIGNAITDDHTLAEFVNGDAILTRGNLMLERSTVARNGAFAGNADGLVSNQAAIHARQGFVNSPSVTLINSTVYNNQVGVFVDAVPLELLNSTIADNHSRGLRVLLDLDNLGQEQILIASTAIVSNHVDCNDMPTNMPEFDVLNNSNISTDLSCGFVGIVDQQGVADPFPGLLTVSTQSPAILVPGADSALIDAAQNCITDEDQRGQSRPLDGNGDALAFCDVGAVEYNAASDPDAFFWDDFEG